MDRYVIREERLGTGNPQANQIISFSSANTGNNVTVFEPENVFYSYGPDMPNVQRANNSGLMIQNPGQIVSGIDPRYLAAYSDTNASYIATGEDHIQKEPNIITPETADSVFYGRYMNKNFVGADKPTARKYVPQITGKEPSTQAVIVPKKPNSFGNKSLQFPIKEEKYQSSPQVSSNEQAKKTSDTILVKKEAQSQQRMRLDKLKALNKSGPRAFTGPVEKVLKWHKALQEVGILILYEIVAKCVSVRPGESCAKNLVVRDENGPAMQVVYYEIDFFLPELKLPCMIRVIGRMFCGTCRLQAFHVRAANGDDVATLPRRAAVAQHHVTKLCKDYIVTN